MIASSVVDVVVVVIYKKMLLLLVSISSSSCYVVLDFMQFCERSSGVAEKESISKISVRRALIVRSDTRHTFHTVQMPPTYMPGTSTKFQFFLFKGYALLNFLKK